MDNKKMKNGLGEVYKKEAEGHEEVKRSSKENEKGGKAMEREKQEDGKNGKTAECGCKYF